MTTESIKTASTTTEYKDADYRQANYPYPVRAIVKDNIDTTHSGIIRVFIAGGADPNDDRSWIPVKYLSPWFGLISPEYDPTKGQDVNGYGSFTGNPHSYGFWATAPDIGSEVICIFVNGRIDDGYYIGGIPKIGLHHMVPAIGAATQIVPNEIEKSTYPGADKLPVSEVNYANPALRKSEKIYSEHKPVHSYQASILHKQGLLRDNVRGVISSSSQRETPSRVYGISTRGQNIYKGGYDNKTIGAAIEKEDSSKLQLKGRTGGHSIVLDDGTIDGKDQLMRFRTSGGHMIMMNDSGQSLFVIHSNGNSWIELGKEGTIDLFATNSVNVRTLGDLNFHADRDINLHAKRDLKMYGENIKVESKLDYSQRVGRNFENYTVGKFTARVDQQMSLFSTGDSSFTSDSTTFIVGQKVHLNTGNTGTIPEVVNEIPKILHIDTIYTESVGWINSPTNAEDDKFESITTRATSHQPYAGAGVGIDVQIKQVSSSGAAPSTISTAANNNSPNLPAVPVSNAAAVTAPSVPDISSGSRSILDKNTVGALVSQQSANLAGLTSDQKLQNGILPVVTGLTLNQASAPGQLLKPGTGKFVSDLQNAGFNLQEIGNNIVTGNNGVKTMNDLLTKVPAQVSTIVDTIKTGAVDLLNKGALNGTESPTQSSGIIAAAATFGSAIATSKIENFISISQTATQLANKFNTTIIPTANVLQNSIAGGKFASGIISQSVTGGLGSLSTSLSGLQTSVGGLTTSLNSIQTKFQGAAKSVIGAVEKSFGSLTASKPVTLGNSGDAPESPSQTQELLKQFNQSTDQIIAAEDAVFAANKSYRNQPNQINLSALQAAETTLSQARQQSAQISQQVYKSMVNVNPNTTASPNTSSSFISTTLNSGLNALPGGISALASQFSGQGKNLIDDITKSTISLAKNLTTSGSNISTSIASNIAKLSQPANLSGDLKNELTGTLSKTFGEIQKQISLNVPANPITNALTQINSTLAGLAGNSSTTKLATLASDTNASDAAIINEKTKELLGDPIIPMPVFGGSIISIISASITNYQKQQSKILKEIADLKVELQTQQYDLDKLRSLSDDSDVSQLSALNTINNNINAINVKIAAKQKEYNQLINPNTNIA